MAARRLNQLLALVVAVLGVAVVWDVFTDSDERPRPVATPDSVAALLPVPAPPAPLPARPVLPRPETSTLAGDVDASPPPDRPGYLELLARADARRQIRAGARVTYLNEIFASSMDSMVHRWDNRIRAPVRVHVTTGTVANFQPAFLDAVQRSFQRWQEAGIPVRFTLVADSTNAEVRVQWRLQFEIDRTGQTDLTWDALGHHQSGVITLATFNQLGQPMDVEEIRIVALHEIGHLLGLDHSPDSTDLMYPVARVRDLSPRDIQSARLLYRLTPGPIR
jgi:hypothetical protein